MRPRLITSENWPQNCTFTGAPSCFNEAEADHLGKPPAGPTSALVSASFNEAEADHLGKRRPPPSPLPAVSGFNEAEADHLGKLP